MTIVVVAAFIMVTGIWKNDKFIRTLKGNVYLIFSGMMLSGCQISFIACVWQTISSHAYILGSLPGIIIILSKFCMCWQTHKLEKIGACIVIFGCVLLMLDGDASKVNDQQDIIFGDILAILCSVFLTFYLILNHKIQKHTSVGILIGYNFVISLLCSSISMYIVYQVDLNILFSLDSEFGLFGYFSSDFICKSLIVLPVSLMTVLGYITLF